MIKKNYVQNYLQSRNKNEKNYHCKKLALRYIYAYIKNMN